MTGHTCHWPGCGKLVPPKLWGCRAHWRRLPKRLRNRIWHHYRPGQEVDKQPSAEYLAVAREVQDWIRQREQEQVNADARIEAAWDRIEAAEPDISTERLLAMTADDTTSGDTTRVIEALARLQRIRNGAAYPVSVSVAALLLAMQ